MVQHARLSSSYSRVQTPYRLPNLDLHSDFMLEFFCYKNMIELVVDEIYDDKVADEVTLLFKKKFQEQ